MKQTPFFTVEASFKQKTLAYILVVIMPVSFILLDYIVSDFTARKIDLVINEDLKESIVNEGLMLKQMIYSMFVIALLIVLGNHVWYLRELNKELIKKKVKKRKEWIILVGLTFIIGAIIAYRKV